MRENFNDLLWFLVVAEERSFTKAAAKIGITQSTLSHTIKRLETGMGLRLLARTTRSVSTTEAGERLRQSLAPRIAGIETDIAALTAYRDKPSGTVRITLADYALEDLVWPKLRPVLADYPDIKLELSRDNGLRNIVEDGFDAGVRLGESLEKDMIAVRIGPDWRLVAVGAPRYFAERGVPQTPQDLIGHDCINMRTSTTGRRCSPATISITRAVTRIRRRSRSRGCLAPQQHDEAGLKAYADPTHHGRTHRARAT
ncbi:bacterial regulatory helix-turn-helix, lysR family protein (plasmid) [Sinorhizobium sp. RAC02]|nr:bacterial regulatory helix-turn-helix, lysR family protein [Sinorhizobium sp. RAC02]